MTMEEAIKWLEETIQDTDTYFTACSKELQKELDEQREVFLTALTALRPVSREQVEKVWRGEWKCHGDCGVTECSACGWNIEEYVGDYNFCPVCGAAQTDEAVQMVMERLEALKDADN